MTASLACAPERVTGFTQDQLARAFDRVRNPRDWKGPIRAVIPAADRQAVQKAVIWFTATVPKFSSVPGKADWLAVTAPGYRLGPAGDQ